VAAHESRSIVAKRHGEASSLVQGPDQHVGVAEFVADVPDWNFATHASGHMDDLTHRHFRD
jgi:hypothetical protein